MNKEFEIKKEVYSYLRNIAIILFLIGILLLVYLGVVKKKVLILIGISFYPLIIGLIILPLVSFILLVFASIKLRKIKKEGEKNEI